MNTRWPLRCLRCVAILAVAPASLAAQRPADRVTVLGLQDSLATATDTAALLALESHTIDSARKHRDDAVLHLRLGLVGLRLATLTGGPGHFRDAEGEFQWATELQPGWPLPWYELGTAELAEADAYPSIFRGLLAAFGRDLFGQPARDLARSAEVDSTFVDGVVEFGNAALRTGIGAHLSAALAALREVAASPAGRDPAVLLVRGRVEREAGDRDSAIMAFKALLARNRFDATALLELARTQLAAGRLSGVAPWYRGLALADSQTAAMYRFDLSLVMSDSALRAFDAARGRARVLVAQRFWESRDPESLGGSAERLREHYRRIDYAHHVYPMMPPGRRYDSLKAFDPTGSQFDDRGRIYVRHGEPDDRASLVFAGLPPNESWVYHRPTGDLLFHFAQPDSAQGYRMYESLLDIVGLGTAARVTKQDSVRARLARGVTVETYGAAWTAQAAQALLYSRQKLSPLYGKMLSAGANGAATLQNAERVAGRQSIAVGLQTDSWKFGYELPLAARIDIVAVGSDAAGPELQVAFAIPGSSLYAPPSTGSVVYPIRMRVAVRTVAGEVVAMIDTLRNFATAAPLAAGDQLLGRLPIQLAPGNYSVRVALETASRGLVTKAQTVHVAALLSPTVDLSDLALGARSVPLPWPTGPSDTAWINPLHEFKASEPMQLFFEVGGLTTGASYHAQLAVLRPGHKDAQVQYGFNAVATGSPDRVHREMDIGRLGSGTYVMRVTVTTPAGGRAVRDREFTVLR